MGLFDLLFEAFLGSTSTGSKIMDKAQNHYNDLEKTAQAMQQKARGLSDTELKDRYREASGVDKNIYAQELKNRGYGN